MTSLPKKKLFIDADCIVTPRPSGIGSMTVQLIHAITNNKEFMDSHQVILIAPVNKAHYIDQWGFKNVHVKRILFPARVIAGLIKFRIMPPVDVFIGKGVYLFPNFRNVPLLFSKSITYIHDVSFRVHPEFVESKNFAFLNKHVERWMKRTDVVVTVSTHAKEEIAQYFAGMVSKTRVVYNGVNATFMPMNESHVGSTLETYNLSYKNYFVFLSNLEPRKNVEGLLAAYKQFLAGSGHDDVKLLMIGGMGWKNEAVLAEIDTINQSGEKIVLPKHYVPDSELPALISGAAALVHPAHYEGFGISPLQAMACGTQVMVANNSSLPEVVGDAGVYVDALDADSIAVGLELVYANRFKINEAGIERAKMFSWDKSAENIIKAIESLE